MTTKQAWKTWFEKTQQQTNSIDCGIYAIAFATDLSYGYDPASLYSMWMEKVKGAFPTMLTKWVHYHLSFNPNEKRKPLLQC